MTFEDLWRSGQQVDVFGLGDVFVVEPGRDVKVRAGFMGIKLVVAQDPDVLRLDRVGAVGDVGIELPHQAVQGGPLFGGETVFADQADADAGAVVAFDMGAGFIGVAAGFGLSADTDNIVVADAGAVGVIEGIAKFS